MWTTYEQWKTLTLPLGGPDLLPSKVRSFDIRRENEKKS